LWALGIDYDTYLRGGSMISLLLGPAVVALAWPLHLELALVRRTLLPVVVGVAIGSGVAVASAVLVTAGLGGDAALTDSMAPKTATTPVAIALSEQIGGVPALTAVLTILTGILGAVAGPRVLTWLRFRDRRVRGLAVGVASHGIGTAQMLVESRTEGAFAGLAMALTALATSVWVAVLVPVLT
jgi:putative effector of murein hydrolase